MDVPPARTIGRYRVLGVLGAGAMGEVLRAHDDRLGREVAVKRVRNVCGALTAQFHARFEAEARALAALAHPGVVQVFDLGRDGDEPYLVMELVDGPSLRSILDERGALPPGEVRALGIQLARALEAAHARGILHRDVKPANVLRAPGGGWKLADFGVARVPDSNLTLVGQFIGTPAYAAPEALALGAFSPASDVFALAALLVEAATGANARRSVAVAELRARAREPIALGGVDPALAAALAPALALDAAARPSAADLARWLAGDATPRPIARIAAVADATSARGDAPAVAAVAVADATSARGGAPAVAVAVADVTSARGDAPAVQTIAVPDGTAHLGAAPAASTVAVPDGSLPGLARAARTVAVPDDSLPGLARTAMAAAEPDGTAVIGGGAARRRRRPRVVAAGVIGAALLLIVIGRACATRDPSGPAADRGATARPDLRRAPPAPPPPRRDEPIVFAMPPDLDRRGAHEWAKIAARVNAEQYGAALEKLWAFEHRFGESVESARLRAWLEQAGTRPDDEP